MAKHYMRLEYYFVVDSETEDAAYAALEAVHKTATFPEIFESYQKDTQDYLPVITDTYGIVPTHYDGVEIYEYKEGE